MKCNINYFVYYCLSIYIYYNNNNNNEKKEVQRLFCSYEINTNRIIYIIFMTEIFIKYLLNIIILNVSMLESLIIS